MTHGNGNRMELTFPAVKENEAFARMVVSAFLMRADPAYSFVSEVRTAVSEAVTNAVVHAYGGGAGMVVLRAALEDGRLIVEIEDFGRGIEDVARAMEPLFTTGAEDERTGMGFTLMQSFMDEVNVRSRPGAGTRVAMKKRLGR